MIVGVVTESISFLSGVLLIQFFRRIRSRQHRISPLNEAFSQMKTKSKMFVQLIAIFLLFNLIFSRKSNPKKAKMARTFPWWCLFIAYGISFLIVGLSIVLIVARGIEFGDEKSQQWLASILSGFFSSVFLTQPFKVNLSFLHFNKLHLLCQGFMCGDLLCLLLRE